jgi:hypothetical protein
MKERGELFSQLFCFGGIGCRCYNHPLIKKKKKKKNLSKAEKYDQFKSIRHPLLKMDPHFEVKKSSHKALQI